MAYEHLVGQTLHGRYFLERIIGVGGMAVVFKAADIEKNRYVALKLLKDEVASDEASVQRFINESKAVSMLNHPNIVSIYDVSMKDRYKYIVMEYIEGVTLKTYMNEKGQLSFDEVVSFVSQILLALEHAHSKGIVHRDIKPQNIMLLKDGKIKVTDFGIAKLPNAETVTVTDKAIGTVYYISPEQAGGKQIDQRSDIYSLGVMMYEMLGGQLPFTADNPVTVAMMQITATAAPLSSLNASVPRGMEQIVAMAMAKEASARYQSATEMLRVLTALHANPKITFKKTKILKPAKPRPNHPVKVRRQSHTLFPIVLGIAIPFFAVAIICGIILLQKLTVVGSTDDYREIKVADFVNRYYSEELETLLEESDIYEVVSISYTYNADVPAGYIVEQSPEAGVTKKVLSGIYKCGISLVISTGAETVTVPNYTIMDYRLVKNAVTRIGLKFNLVWEVNDAIDYGYVIRTIPAPGEEVNINTEITLVVSRGQPGGNIILPDYTGQNEMFTFSSIITAGLRIGSVTYAPSDSIAKGLVVSQTPAPSTRVSRNMTINIVLSSGPDGIPMPSVISMNHEDAQTLLSEKYMLTNVSLIWVYDQTVSENCVIRTYPNVDDRVYETSEIVLFVSKGPSITLPNYTNQEAQSVMNELSSVGIVIRETYEYSDTIPRGQVIQTNPSAGTEVGIHSPVEVVISRGMSIVLEDYSGQNIHDILPVLEGKGLIVEVVPLEVEEYDNYGVILNMDYEVGAVLESGMTITFTVSKGKEDHRIILDNYVGMNYQIAKIQLENLGLVVNISYVTISDQDPDTVLLMSPFPGDSVDPGTTITLIVALNSNQ